MVKADVIQRLRELALDPDEYWLITGGAMVLYGLRAETGDIDLGCSKKLADQLEEQGHPTTLCENGTRKITIGDDVEIFEDWLYDSIVEVEGFPLISLKGLIEMKRSIGREKDFNDIRRIENFLNSQPI